MHTVISTPTFLSQAKRCGLSENEMDEIVKAISDDPQSGDVMRGTGGARKLRHVGRGQGKSGGYRTIHYYGGDDVPIFLLSVYGKGATANLSKAEKNELAKILPKLADAYRDNVKREVAKRGTGSEKRRTK